MTALNDLRKIFIKQSLSAFLQPVHDEFLNEYSPACNRRVEWLCGFSGSAGAVAVTIDKAALFTDGRYTLQAKQEVDEQSYALFNSGTVSAEAWLAGEMKAGERVGYDPRLYTRSMVARMEKVLAAKQVELVPVVNLVDMVWKDRPAVPASPLFVHEAAYHGQESVEKRKAVAKVIQDAGANAALIAAPDAVCWLLNIRARDIENTPLLLAVALVDAMGKAQLFVSPSRVDAQVAAHLGKDVELVDPVLLEARLKALGAAKARVLCDPQVVPVWFTQCLLGAGAHIVEQPDPCLLPKACKNAVEIAGIRRAHVRDGAAVVKLLCWLEARVAGQPVTELEVCDALLGFRAQHALFLEPSFNTISGSGLNGAIVHYRASEASNRVLQKGELFLLDSGGQYPDGTTDITRTVAIVDSTPEQRDRFTRVLKGHIALGMAIFPEGTSGSQLDALARNALWQAGLDYDHGTGHGVGCFLNVHEGPQMISKRGGDAALMVGMVVSNEPGYYKAGAFGIRIENLVTVVEAVGEAGAKRWLSFDTLTCVPIDTRLVDVQLLTQSEKDWLNAYHAWVLRSLGDLLDAREQAWLSTACTPV